MNHDSEFLDFDEYAWIEAIERTVYKALYKK